MRIGEDGSPRLPEAHYASVVDLASLAMLVDVPRVFIDWRLDDHDAERVIRALHANHVFGESFARWGHSWLAAARALMSFDGRCDGCAAVIDLTADDAREVDVETITSGEGSGALVKGAISPVISHL
ncbi:hypothetical protein KL864_18125 [Mycolicibacterium goodii]|uniref:hypothetical protein n=1 Tax=Mycolicibacterium goodii TaxID=134601 RepID=UPI001BDD185F|nr:hypothetical protein [Mycolicibacterium goodii]MBU8817820.1 hypothetical protein [Mycolicibacterium goodii]